MPLPPPLPETVCRPLRRNLARCSAIIGVVALLLPPLFGLIRWFLPGMPGERVIQFSLTFVLVLTGLICGAIALSGLGRHGPKGILAPGLTGLLLNLLLGGFFAAGMLAARREGAARTKLLSATQPLRQTSQEMNTSVSNGTPVKPPEIDLRDLGKNIKDASRMLSGDNRLITEANANLVSRLRPITTS